jgi:hypothetical protein
MIDEEREKLKQQAYEEYLKPPMDAQFEIEATQRILNDWLMPQRREGKPTVVHGTTVAAAFDIVDHDHDKVRAY